MRTITLRLILKAARSYHLNLTQTEALCLLVEHRNVTVGALAMHLGVSTAAVTHIADTLVRHGFVERRAGMSDRRHIWLDITSLGQAILEKIVHKTTAPLEVVDAGKMAAAI